MLMTDPAQQIKRLETAINALAKRIAFLERENKRIRSEVQQIPKNKG
jgi:cell division protein FtsB